MLFINALFTFFFYYYYFIVIKENIIIEILKLNQISKIKTICKINKLNDNPYNIFVY